MRMPGFLFAIAGLFLATHPGIAGAQSIKKTPYWASLAKGEAIMRVGPKKDFPASWVYLRRDLPVKVIKVFTDWREVEDPDGTVGWMHVRLLKDEATAILIRDGSLRDKPTSSSRILYRLKVGVVGKVSGCAEGWCGFEVQGKNGYVEAATLWGAVD